MECLLNLTTVCFSLLTLSLTLYLFTHFFPNSRTPSPQSYPVIGNLIGFLRNRHRFHDWVAEMLATTPSLTLQVNGFLGLSHGVCTANPSNIDHLLRANFPNYVKGTRFKSVLDELIGDGIFSVDGDLWSAQRKIASHEFNTKSLKKFISTTVQSQLCNRLIPLLSSVCGTQKVIDLQDIFRRFMFDNICSVAFGVDPAWLGTNQNSENSEFVRAFDYAVEVSSGRFLSPLPAIWKIKRLLNIGSEKRYRESIKIIDEYAMNIIASKEKSRDGQEQQPNQDLLSRFMDSTSRIGVYDQDEQRKLVRDIIISFILAGKDSTSTALTWFFWLIAGHPRCEALIYSELREAAAAAATESQKQRFDYESLKKLHYFHAAISESLRLFPPVPINSRLAVRRDVLSDGTQVGKGWFADYSAYAMGRMKKVWGDDCWEFKPERWLDGFGVFQACDQFKFPVFHCGPRTCLGKDMAYVQMKCVAAELIYEFRVVAVDGGGQPERIMHPPYTLSLLLKMKGGLPVRLYRRQLPNNV